MDPNFMSELEERLQALQELIQKYQEGDDSEAEQQEEETEEERQEGEEEEEEAGPPKKQRKKKIEKMLMKNDENFAPPLMPDLESKLSDKSKDKRKGALIMIVLGKPKKEK